MEIDTNEVILIVMNVRRVLKPLQVILRVEKEWHAIRMMLGWTPGPLGGKHGDVLVFCLPLPLQDLSK